MLSVCIDAPGEPSRHLRIDTFPCIIGRHSETPWNLRSWRVARAHARLDVVGEGLTISDLGSLAGTWVNGQRIAQYGPLGEADEIQIAGYRIRLEAFSADSEAALEGGSSASVKKSGSSPGNSTRSANLQMSEPRSSVARVASVAGAALTELELHWRRRLHRQLLETIDLRRHDIRLLGNEALEALVLSTLNELLDKTEDFPPSLARAEVVMQVCYEAIGLGPLENLLKDDSISEIMVNGLMPIYVERQGRLQQTPWRFSNVEAIRAVIDRIVAPIGRRIDEASPMVDARLQDGSRVNAVISPLAVNGPSITIRRFNRRMMSPSDLIRLGSASPIMIEFLRLCVEQRLNIIVAGGTGSGKTTLLNLLSAMIDEDQRIVTIEDAAELRLNHQNLVTLEARPANSEGRGLVLIRDLVKNALRMRPDRIVVGECRGGEALDMLQAMNTGHDGSLTTIHANSPRDVISRLEVMALMAGMDIPVQAIREQVASAVNIIVQQARFPDGTRRITEITEVTGIEGSRVLMQAIFRFKRATDPGRPGGFEATGQVPQFIEEVGQQGVRFDLSWFEEKA
jgi:pilus assembly protein CpaF